MDEVQERVIAVISTVSFKRTDTKTSETIEGKIVQDADRIDASGAIGIVRACTDPSELTAKKPSESEYRSRESTMVNHFYGKILPAEKYDEYQNRA